MSAEGDGEGPGAASPGGPTRDDLLDNTPEAVATRRARAARAAETSAPPPQARPTSRRRLVVGGLLAALAALRVVERALRAGRQP